jgi:integrase
VEEEARQSDEVQPRHRGRQHVARGERPRSSRNQVEAKALSPIQVRALLTAADGERNEALYVVAVHTGLRQGELLGLRWTDVDLDTGRLSVRSSLKVVNHGLNLGPTKNKASRRSVPLNKSAVGALRAHRLRQNEERLRLGELLGGPRSCLSQPCG